VRKRVCSVTFSRACLRILPLGVLVACSEPLLHAQEIHIRVLNGKNGKPIVNECPNVSLGRWRGGDLIAPTGKEGDVVLHLRNGDVTADGPPDACNGSAVLGPKSLPNGTDVITPLDDYYVGCQEYGKVIPGEPTGPDAARERMPSYPIKKILESGVAAGNTCGAFRATAKPGELILFVRPQHWWEALKL